MRRASNSIQCNDVNSTSWAHTHKSQWRRKIHEKKRERPWHDFSKCRSNSPRKLLEPFSRLYEPIFFILPREISHGSEMISTDTKSSIISVLRALQKSLAILTIFWAVCFGKSSQYLTVCSCSTYHKDLKLGQEIWMIRHTSITFESSICWHFTNILPLGH